MRLGIFATHPIQYQAPLFRELARREGIELKVTFAHRPSPEDQGVGFNHAFVWRDDPSRGYDHDWLSNTAVDPGLHHFGGISTPTIREAWEVDQPDVVVIPGWQFRACLQAMSAARELKIPYALWGDSQLDPRRGRLWHLIHRLHRRHHVRHAARVLAFGQRSEAFFRHLGARRVDRLLHTIDGESFAIGARDVSKAEAREKWNLPADGRIILFAGKLQPKKRPHLLFEQFARVAEPDWHLLVVGEGPLRPALERQAKANQIPVTFTGFLDQTEMPAAYRAADLLVLPSDFGETWGLVANEAAACGCPVLLSSACGSTPEFTAPPAAAEVFPWNEPDELGNSLRRLVAHPQRLSALSAAGLAFSARMTPAHAADALLAALADVR